MQPVADRLAAIVRDIEPRLRAIADADTAIRPTPAAWSKKEILGHLIDSASNNHQRFVRLQLATDLSLPMYEQEGWVRVQHYQSTDWAALIELWKAYNLHLARVIRDAEPAALTHLGRVGHGEQVTLEFLIEDYVVHMEHHLKDLMA